MDARRGDDDDADSAEPDSCEPDTCEPGTCEPDTCEPDTGVDANAAPTVPTQRTRRYPTDVSDDDRDLGWGELPGGTDRGDSWYLRERPPHHG